MAHPQTGSSRNAPLLLVAVLAAVVSLGGAAGWLLGGWDFIHQHWGALLLAGTLAALTLSLTWKTGALLLRGAALALRRPRTLGQSGSAYAEFVIVIIPFMLMLTSLMQLALASLARVLVSYAAFTAARAAIVLVPLGPSDTSPIAAQLGGEGGNKLGYGSNQRIDYSVSKKAALLRNAASYVMIPASPSIDIVVQDTMNNWSSYWQNRKSAGVNPIDMVVDLVGQVSNLPPAQQQQFDQGVRDIFKDGIKTPQEKAAAKVKVDALVQQLPQDKRAAARSKLDTYIDNYKGGADGAPGDGSDEWVVNNVNDSMQGPLSKFKNDIISMYWTARSGQNGGVGGNFSGYSVDRALDSGFGGGTDGAGGAILRALRKFVYARVATTVILTDKAGNIRSTFAWGEPITARVTHLYYCQIPLANRVAGKAFYDLPLQTQLDTTTGPLGYAGAVGIPGYFMALTATHTLVNQGRP